LVTRQTDDRPRNFLSFAGGRPSNAPTVGRRKRCYSCVVVVLPADDVPPEGGSAAEPVRLTPSFVIPGEADGDAAGLVTATGVAVAVGSVR
jgi:hypothetical protein